VDITKEASDTHPGGLTQELASIYAVVNSLTQNVEGISQVQILIEGAETETLAGHIDLTKPFREDLSMIAMTGGIPP
jgi:germination protein M